MFSHSAVLKPMTRVLNKGSFQILRQKLPSRVAPYGRNLFQRNLTCRYRTSNSISESGKSHEQRSRTLSSLSAVNAAAAVEVDPSQQQLGAMSWPTRTGGAGTMGNVEIGSQVTLCGWVDKYRNHGGVVFIDVRDHTGFCQVVSLPEDFPEGHAVCERLRNEYVVAVTGTLRTRENPNNKVATGQVEVVAEHVELLNSVNRGLPLKVTASKEEEAALSEDTRLKHRILDLRRPTMSSNLRLRHRVVKTIRRFLEDQHDFTEIETPILGRPTPEGARDFLVPARLQPGACFALPQSPQLFKQMLMVAGMDRYYQIAKCFRDEDLRADRQPEFTQVDMEMAFMPLESLLDLNESLVCEVWKEIKGQEPPRPFPRLTYKEAMDRYGCDKPDTRYGLELVNVTDIVADCGFVVFAGAVKDGGIVKAIRIPDGKRISNGKIKPKGVIANEAVAAGSRGLAFARVAGGDAGTLEGPKALVEGLSEEQTASLIEKMGGQAEDLFLFAAGEEGLVNKTLDRVRQFVAKSLGEVPEGEDRFLWVTDFPMFEWNKDEERLEALHHPFTAPNPDQIDDLKTATAQAYDIVLNGVEIGGGSLRIYRSDVQKQVFEAIGLSEEEARDKFGYLLDAFELGAPPHAGIAYGLDRMVMMLAGQQSIRDVIAFPKTAGASCLLTEAPGDVTDQQLEELHVKRADAPKAE